MNVTLKPVNYIIDWSAGPSRGMTEIKKRQFLRHFRCDAFHANRFFAMDEKIPTNIRRNAVF